MRVSDSINLSRAYDQINALGGYVDRSDPVAVARDELLGDVLAILERHGARDTLNDGLMDAEAEAALDAVLAAERRRLTVALLITRANATRYAFPRNNADDAIASSVAKVTETRAKMDRLIGSRASKKPGTIVPSASAICHDLQRHVTENEARSNIVTIGPAMTAAAQVDAADKVLVTAAHSAGIRIPSPDDFQSGFHSPMAG